jgi:hypothetical protein
MFATTNTQLEKMLHWDLIYSHQPVFSSSAAATGPTISASNSVSVGFSLENYYFCKVRGASVTARRFTYIIVVTSIATLHKDAERLSCSRPCTMQIRMWSKSLPAATPNVRVYVKTFEVRDSWCEVNFVVSCITMYNMWCLFASCHKSKGLKGKGKCIISVHYKENVMLHKTLWFMTHDRFLGFIYYNV